MAHYRQCAVPIDEAITYIMAMAKRPVGVSLAEVAEYCEISAHAARNRLKAACEVHAELTRSVRKKGLRESDVRWFTNPEHATAFEGHAAPRAAQIVPPRQPITVVELPTQRLPSVTRPGALDFMQYGSRRGNWIFYPDGSRQPITTN